MFPSSTIFTFFVLNRSCKSCEYPLIRDSLIDLEYQLGDFRSASVIGQRWIFAGTERKKKKKPANEGKLRLIRYRMIILRAFVPNSCIRSVQDALVWYTRRLSTVSIRICEIGNSDSVAGSCVFHWPIFTRSAFLTLQSRSMESMNLVLEGWKKKSWITFNHSCLYYTLRDILWMSVKICNIFIRSESNLSKLNCRQIEFEQINWIKSQVWILFYAFTCDFCL